MGGTTMLFILTNGEKLSLAFETREEAEEFLENTRDGFASPANEILFMPRQLLLRYKDVAAIRIEPEWKDVG